MWHLLLFAAVAGTTGFVTKHFLTHPNTVHEAENANLHDPNNASAFSISESDSHRDGVFTFSSSKSPTQQHGDKSRRSRTSRNEARVPKVEARSEQRNGGKRLHFCLKKRKSVKNVSTKAPFRYFKGLNWGRSVIMVTESKNLDDCEPLLKTLTHTIGIFNNSLFGWGLCFGLTSMMSAGKAEINKLNKTMDETGKLVQELKSELSRRKSSRALQNLDSVGNDVTNSCKISSKNDIMIKNTGSELRDTDVIIWSPDVNGCGECGSSALTDEPEPQVLEMDQLEAELEFELQKLSGCTTDDPSHAKIKPDLDEFEAPDEGYHGTDDWNLSYSESHGVSASELDQKLSHLLIKQQEKQIMELESELHQAQSNLHEKEAELQTLKNCVKRLTELSLSTVSDDETEALTDSKGTSNYGSNNIDPEWRHSVVGMKRPLDSESCSCYM